MHKATSIGYSTEGRPVIGCACGRNFCGMTFALAGAFFDIHVEGSKEAITKPLPRLDPKKIGVPDHSGQGLAELYDLTSHLKED